MDSLSLPFALAEDEKLIRGDSFEGLSGRGEGHSEIWTLACARRSAVSAFPCPAFGLGQEMYQLNNSQSHH
jgi:hypothetical protein